MTGTNQGDQLLQTSKHNKTHILESPPELTLPKKKNIIT
jgi:hypothetical protein